ncbi:MAG TPA: fibronectin type III domain-containing protein, partial [Candidatus Thermoplasmatota archaeon]|nr:fibronectin type III domain-containing protein [Candidatus Thermoplasmatota archaeon]
AIVVERSTLDGPFERVAGVARDRASFVDTGLVPLLAYRYRVLAENAVATGPLSPEVCARANPWPTAECASDAVS